MLEQSDIKKLFAVLQARYGHKWTTAYDDPQIMAIAVNEWHRELRGFRPEDIRKGITSWDGEWPPALPEFSRACMPEIPQLESDIEREIQRQLPGYYYESHNQQEVRRRNDLRDEITRRVTKRLTTEALLNIQEHGVQALLDGVKPELLIGKDHV